MRWSLCSCLLLVEVPGCAMEQSSVEEQALVAGLPCSQHRWWECPVDFSPPEAAPQLLLADEFPRPHFLFCFGRSAFFLDRTSCSTGSVSGIYTPEHEGANGCTSVLLVHLTCSRRAGFITMVRVPHWKNVCGFASERFLWSRNIHLHLYFYKFQPTPPS